MVFILPKIERLYMAVEHLGNIKFVLISSSTFKKNVDLKFQLTYYKELIKKKKKIDLLQRSADKFFGEI